jgi:hypothetical protein
MPNRPHPFAALALAAPLAMGGCIEEAVPEGEISLEEAEIFGGGPDSSNPTRNAVVSLSTGCTGTLVAPDVVMTSGHCMPSDPSAPYLENQTWEPLIAPVTVQFGPNPAAPITTATATMVNFVGGDDIALLGLTSGPALTGTPQRVPTSTAIPRAILFEEPQELDENTVLTHAGFGAETSLMNRAIGFSLEYRHFMSRVDPALADNYFCFNDVGGELAGGDSGSPVLIDGITGPVIGVYQGNATCRLVEHASAPTTGENDGAVMTFGHGNPFTPKNDVSLWLKRFTGRSFCASSGSTLSTSDGGAHRRLQSWWSGARLDNFLTTQDGWRGCFTDWDTNFEHSGYDFFEFDGWVANPSLPRPADTVALHLFFNGSSLDNATSTTATPPGAGWSMGPRLGWIWTAPAADRVPLRLWFSSSRQDFLTTTRTTDYSTSGYVRVGPGVGGGGPGVIGFVRTRTSVF